MLHSKCCLARNSYLKFFNVCSNSIKKIYLIFILLCVFVFFVLSKFYVGTEKEQEFKLEEKFTIEDLHDVVQKNADILDNLLLHSFNKSKTKEFNLFKKLILDNTRINYPVHNEIGLNYLSSYECACTKFGSPVCLYRNICASISNNNSVVQWTFVGCSSKKKLINPSCKVRDFDGCFQPKCYGEVDKLKSAIKLPGLYALINTYVEGNAGHAFADNVWPVYQGMELFNMLDTSIQILTDTNKKYKTAISKMMLKAYSAISEKPAQNLNNLIIQHSHSNFVCLENVLVGWQQLGYANGLNKIFELRNQVYQLPCLPDFSTSFWNFRTFILNRFKISDRTVPHKPVIRFLRKPRGQMHDSVIINIEQVVLAIQAAFQYTQVETTFLGNITTIKEQVELISGTDILISLPGANLIDAVFLPRGSEVIVPCRKYKQFLLTSDEVHIWFKNSHVHVSEYCMHRAFIEESPVLDISWILSFVEKSLERLYKKGIISI